MIVSGAEPCALSWSSCRSKEHGRYSRDSLVVECDLGPLQIASQVTLSQFLRQIGLTVAHGTADRSVVVVAFLGFVIAAEIDPDEPSAVAREMI